jgi:hypothetical protein
LLFAPHSPPLSRASVILRPLYAASDACGVSNLYSALRLAHILLGDFGWRRDLLASVRCSRLSLAGCIWLAVN